MDRTIRDGAHLVSFRRSMPPDKLRLRQMGTEPLRFIRPKSIAPLNNVALADQTSLFAVRLNFFENLRFRLFEQDTA